LHHIWFSLTTLHPRFRASSTPLRMVIASVIVADSTCYRSISGSWISVINIEDTAYEGIRTWIVNLHHWLLRKWCVGQRIRVDWVCLSCQYKMTICWWNIYTSFIIKKIFLVCIWFGNLTCHLYDIETFPSGGEII
jgi:hypothetical protein